MHGHPLVVTLLYPFTGSCTILVVLFPFDEVKFQWHVSNHPQFYNRCITNLQNTHRHYHIIASTMRNKRLRLMVLAIHTLFWTFFRRLKRIYIYKRNQKQKLNNDDDYRNNDIYVNDKSHKHQSLWSQWHYIIFANAFSCHKICLELPRSFYEMNMNMSINMVDKQI